MPEQRVTQRLNCFLLGGALASEPQAVLEVPACEFLFRLLAPGAKLGESIVVGEFANSAGMSAYEAVTAMLPALGLRPSNMTLGWLARDQAPEHQCQFFAKWADVRTLTSANGNSCLFGSPYRLRRVT